MIRDLVLGYVGWCERLVSNKFNLAVLACINLFGAALGYVLYESHLGVVPAYLWVFTVDCPLFTALMVVLLLFRGSRFVGGFSFLVFFGLVKYGLWTATAWALYAGKIFYFMPEVNLIIYVLHFGMVLEAFIIFNPARAAGRTAVFFSVFFMFANDFLDYFAGLHPNLPGSEFLWVLFAQNMLLNILIPVFLFRFFRR